MFISGGVESFLQGAVNAKVDLTTDAVTILYTAPSAATFNFSLCHSILVSEDSGNADTIDVTLTSGSDVFRLFKVKAVSANGTVELLTRDLVINSGEILKVEAATANRLHVVASILNLQITDNDTYFFEYVRKR